MIDLPVLFLGGLVCGSVAGAAAQYGRLCTFAAIEDAVVANDFRRARAFVLALSTALLTTQSLAAWGVIELSSNTYAQSHIELAGLIFGATLFGLGMSLVGTCGFGLLVRLGTGDLRALVSAATLGITAAAATGGVLAPLRLGIANLYMLDSDALHWQAFTACLSYWTKAPPGLVLALTVSTALVSWSLSALRFRRRRHLVIAGFCLGLAVAGGWLVTGALADPFGGQRLESLTFVAPLARLIQLTMGETLNAASFGVASVLGVAAGSFVIASWRDELRWEAFDDQREMRRHLLGACFMGFGGVLARGCTIGQGLSAASTLAASAPVAIICMLIGARSGLFYLIEGRKMLWWRNGKPSRKF